MYLRIPMVSQVHKMIKPAGRGVPGQLSSPQHGGPVHNPITTSLSQVAPLQQGSTQAHSTSKSNLLPLAPQRNPLLQLARKGGGGAQA